MFKRFSSLEEVASDEDFQAWYTGTDDGRAARWQTWLAENPQYTALADETANYLNAIRLSDEEVPVQQTEAAHQRLMQSLQGTTPVVKMGNKRARWWLSAAAVLFLLIAGTLWWKRGGGEPLKFNTAYGQVAQYKLPDGSEVMLNANSKLSMQKWEQGTDREVWIEGEAFFHVKKTTLKNRFIVHARQLDIIVTGTQFNVVNREGETAVLLKEGSVSLQIAGGKLIKMMPGDYVTINNSLPVKRSAPQEKVLAWTEAKLVFENTSMTEAQKMIARHYGVTVKVEQGIEKKTLSGILPNDNLDVLLKALEATTDFHIERKGGEIIIAAPQQ